MTMRSIDVLLADVPAFAGIRPADLELIAGCATNVHFGPEEPIFRAGEPADVFYVVRSGTVAIELFTARRGAMTIETLHDGDLFGWSSLTPPHLWEFDARSVDTVRAIAFDAACLRGKFDANHELGYQLLTRFAQVMTRLLNATRVQLLDIYGDGG